MIRIDNVDDTFVEKAIEYYAEHPSEKIIEERTLEQDQFGRPIQKIRTTRAGTVQKEEEEKEKAEKASAL